METCTQNYGKIKSIVYVPTYNYILSAKVRDYLVRKWWAKIGVEQPKTNALSHWNKGYVSVTPEWCEEHHKMDCVRCWHDQCD